MAKRKAAESAPPEKRKGAAREKSSARDLITLEFPDNIRKRPDMYIGTIGPNGVFHMFIEALANVIDLFEEGAAKNVWVSINEKTSEIHVGDDGYGIPIEKAVDAVTRTHTSGKFDDEDFSIGKNGVGLKAINALSEEFTVVIRHRDTGHKYRMTFRKGIQKGKLEKLEKVKEFGTDVFFRPDPEVMENVEIDHSPYVALCEELSYLTPGLTYHIHVVRRSGGELNKKLLSKNGLLDYMAKIERRSLLKRPIVIEDRSTFVRKRRGEEKTLNREFRAVLTWRKPDAKKDKEDELILSYVNHMRTKDHGTHVQGFSAALTEVVRKYIADKKLIQKNEGKIEVTGDDVRETLTAVLEVRWPGPMFDSQTKDKLTSSEVMGYVKKVVADQLSEWMSRNPSEAKALCQAVINNAKGRLASKRARQAAKRRSEGFASISSVDKLTKCNSPDPRERELFIVEGTSAGGTTKSARDTRTQAVYLLRGKPLNTHDLKMLRIEANKEFSDIINVLGCGAGRAFNYDGLQYHKIVIMTDADVDGSHIQSLLLTFFWKHTPELITRGHVFVAQPPLYKIREGGKDVYIKNKEEYNRYVDSRILSEFEFGMIRKSSGKAVPAPFEPERASEFLKETRNYILDLDNAAAKFALDPSLVELIAMSRGLEPKGLAAAISKRYPEVRAKPVKGGVAVEGLIGENYQSVLVDDAFLAEIERVSSVFERFGISGKMFYRRKGEKRAATGFPSDFLRAAYDAAVPKERQRYKGLGEMDPDQLRDTAMGPNRELIQVTVEDAERANEKFEIHMGKNADRRKEFMAKFEIDPEDLDR